MRRSLMCWKKKELTEAADKIGEILHYQLTSVLKQKNEIYHYPEEMVFTTAYLTSFIGVVFSYLECTDANIQSKYIKHICNGVYPKDYGISFKEVIN
jgi:hypothetical protein